MKQYGLHYQKHTAEDRNYRIIVTNRFALLVLSTVNIIFSIYKLYCLLLKCWIYNKPSSQTTSFWSSFALRGLCICNLFLH